MQLEHFIDGDLHLNELRDVGGCILFVDSLHPLVALIITSNRAKRIVAVVPVIHLIVPNMKFLCLNGAYGSADVSLTFAQ